MVSGKNIQGHGNMLLKWVFHRISLEASTAESAQQIIAVLQHPPCRQNRDKQERGQLCCKSYLFWGFTKKNCILQLASQRQKKITRRKLRKFIIKQLECDGRTELSRAWFHNFQIWLRTYCKHCYRCLGSLQKSFYKKKLL